MGTPSPGPHQVDRGQSQKQRQRGDDFEIQNGLAADAAHALHVAAAGDAHHQRAEQQRRDDGADQPQEHVADRAQLPGESGRRDAQRHARGHADKDPGGEGEPFHRSPHFSFWRSTSKNIMLRRADQVQRIMRAAAHNGIALADGRAHLAIDGEVDALIRAARKHADHAGFGHQHRTVGQHVRADGREADGRHGREDDRPAGRKRIGRGAGGRGDDQAVGLVGADELLVHVGRPDRSCGRWRTW